MKRKIFSKLLMVALVIAAVGSFVSCKDYDDDINNLQKQIDAKAAISQIENLQTQLTKAQGDATAAATAAANALKEAQAKTTDAAVKTAIDEAIAKVNAAAEEAAKKTAEAIQKASDDAAAAAKAAEEAKTSGDAAAATAKEEAVAAAQAAAKSAADEAYAKALEAIKAEIAKISIPDVSGFLTEAQVKALISQNAQAKGDYVTATSLNEQLEAIKQSIPGAVDLSGITQSIESYSGAISELYSAITSVSLFGNVHEGNQNSATNNFDHLLNFLYVIEKENVFAKDVKFGGTNTADQKVADKQYTFEEGYYRTFADSIMIRVSPVNAKFTKDDLVLINSKGEDIVKSGLIEEVTVEPYTRLYALTRANAEQTGLYVVKFKLKDQFNENEAAQFKAAALLRENGRDLKVAYAIGIKNTKTPENGEDRYVVSEYDLTMQTALAVHAWNFRVNDVDAWNIHNRWQSDDNGDATTQIPDLEWLDNNEPSTTVVLTGANANAGDRATGNDNRQWQQILSVVKGEPITIEFTNPIKGFYVTLDNAFATESKPSELNAWASYTYDGGVGYWKINGNDTTVVAATMHDGNVGTIAVKDMGNALGDIIGFRVYAVNLDGTLVDPDGRAFYVKIANPVDDTQKINQGKAIEIKATKQFGSEASVSVADVKFDNTVTNWFIEWGEENPDIYNGNFRSPKAGSAQYVINTVSGAQQTSYPGYWFTLTFTDTEGNEYKENGTTYSSSVYQSNTVFYRDLANAIRNGAKIASLKVAIDANNNYLGALGLIDNATYNLVLRGVRQTGNVTEEIQTIALSVKKVLPTAIPDVKVKAGQVANLTFNMKPYIANLNGPATVYNYSWSGYQANGTWINLPTWNPSNAWDVRFAPVSLYGIGYEVKNFADIYSLINPETGANVLDQNYYFEFVDGALQGDDAGKVIPAVSRYNQNGTYNVANFTDNTYGNRANASAVAYCLPKIQKGSISVAGVKKDVQIGYTYLNVSLKKNENGAAVMNNVEVAAANKFEYTYKSAFDMSKIKDNGATATVQNLTYATNGTANANHITYKEAATAPDAWFELPADGSTLAQLVANHYIEVVDGSATFTGLTDYFVMSNFNYTTLVATFNKIVDTQDHNITDDVTGKVSFKIKDVWGNQQTVEIPLKMPKP
jgi:hypothetical protein